MSKVTENDLVLDVACGPGLVACEFAKYAQHVTGIDLTAMMIEQSRKRQKELCLSNTSWDVGTAYPLPYATNSYNLVITRYSFHHFIDPKLVLMEMIRVCKPGGGVLIADAASKSITFTHLIKTIIFELGAGCLYLQPAPMKNFNPINESNI